MHYLRYLKVINNLPKLKKEIFNFESSNGISLPPVYKAFITTFDIEHVESVKLLAYFDKEINDTLQFYISEFIKDDHINILKLFRLDEIIKNMKAVYVKDDIVWEKNLIAIGSCNDQGYILVGIGEKNKDKIYIEYAHTDPRIKQVSENVFDFFQNYYVEALTEDLPKGKGLTDLYKNWGEDFWRVREEKKEEKSNI